MLAAALLVMGLISISRLSVQLLPDGLEPRFLWVNVPFYNASPAETDDLVIRPIAEELATLSGLSNQRSTATSNNASFALEFQSSVPMNEAYNEVVERLERAMPRLPDEVERYFVYKYNPADTPIVWAGVIIPDTVENPSQLMERVVQPKLDRIPGVASVDVWGVSGQRLQIYYDRESLLSHGIDIGSVQGALGSDNFQRGGGKIVDQGQTRHIRSLARLTSPDELSEYPIRDDGLVLSDISEIGLLNLGSADIDRINGQPSAALAIRKESSANTVETAAAVKKVFDEFAEDPRLTGVEFLVFFDQGDIISDSLGTLVGAAETGGLFCVIILFLFLREWRMTLLISLAIPFSMLITLAALYFRGDTLNIVAMMGLMLAIGMVVDNAIVIVESIYRQRSLGLSPKEAAIEGSSEVNMAIIASTATTMVVFLPVILMTDDADVSFLLGVLGFPVLLALAASLLVALVFIPLATLVVSRGNKGEVDLAEKGESRWLAYLRTRYRKVLAWSLTHRFDMTAALFAVLVISGIAGTQVDFDTSGGADNDNFTINFTVPRDATVAERDDIGMRFETLLADNKERLFLDIYRLQLGASGTRGSVQVYLEGEREMLKDDIINEVKDLLPTDMPGVVASVGWGEESDGKGKLSIPLYGEDYDILRGLAEEMIRRTRGLDNVLRVEVGDLEEGQPELQLHPDEDSLRQYGLRARDVAQTIAFAMRGNQLNPLIDGANEVEVQTRLSPEDRSDLGALLDFPVWSPSTMQAVPVRALTDIEYGQSPSAIRRTNGRTAMVVNFDLNKEISRQEIVPTIMDALADMKMPRGYSMDTDQWRADLENENSATIFALGMSVIFVYLLMGVLFESWLLPVSILATLPLAAIGVVWALLLTGTSLDQMAFIGLIVLVGVVVNNGIVLVDLITQLRLEGLERTEAIMQACQTRLRPILMTAMTTIFGLIPMAMGSSDFIGIPYAPLGRVVIGGLTASTVLTLVCIPFLYAALDDLRINTGRWFSALRE